MAIINPSTPSSPDPIDPTLGTETRNFQKTFEIRNNETNEILLSGTFESTWTRSYTRFPRTGEVFLPTSCGSSYELSPAYITTALLSGSFLKFSFSDIFSEQMLTYDSAFSEPEIEFSLKSLSRSVNIYTYTNGILHPVPTLTSTSLNPETNYYISTEFIYNIYSSRESELNTKLNRTIPHSNIIHTQHLIIPNSNTYSAAERVYIHLAKPPYDLIDDKFYVNFNGIKTNILNILEPISSDFVNMDQTRTIEYGFAANYNITSTFKVPFYSNNLGAFGNTPEYKLLYKNAQAVKEFAVKGNCPCGFINTEDYKKNSFYSKSYFSYNTANGTLINSPSVDGILIERDNSKLVIKEVHYNVSTLPDELIGNIQLEIRNTTTVHSYDFPEGVTPDSINLLCVAEGGNGGFVEGSYSQSQLPSNFNQYNFCTGSGGSGALGYYNLDLNSNFLILCGNRVNQQIYNSLKKNIAIFKNYNYVDSSTIEINLTTEIPAVVLYAGKSANSMSGITNGNLTITNYDDVSNIPQFINLALYPNQEEFTALYNTYGSGGTKLNNNQEKIVTLYEQTGVDGTKYDLNTGTRILVERNAMQINMHLPIYDRIIAVRDQKVLSQQYNSSVTTFNNIGIPITYCINGGTTEILQNLESKNLDFKNGNKTSIITNLKDILSPGCGGEGHPLNIKKASDIFTTTSAINIYDNPASAYYSKNASIFYIGGPAFIGLYY